MTSTTTCEHYGAPPFSTSTCVTVADDATNTPQYINGFSYGDIVTGFFLCVLLLIALFGGIVNQVAGVKVRSLVTKRPVK